MPRRRPPAGPAGRFNPFFLALALGTGCQGPIGAPALMTDGGGDQGPSNTGGAAAGGTSGGSGGVASTGGTSASGGSTGMPDGTGGSPPGLGGAGASGGISGAGLGGKAGAPGGHGGTTGGGNGGRTAPGTGGAVMGTGGAAGGSTPGAGGAAGGTGTMGIINVGYGGIRIVSRDLGKTWQNEIHWAADGGDDQNLLRGIAYGNGIWVAGGWRVTTSVDGVTWVDRGMAKDVITATACNVTDSIAFGAGRFLCACGDHLVWSTDALVWKTLTSTPKVQGHPALVFDPVTARFAVTGDNAKSYVSSDGGATWTELAGVSSVRLCKGELRAESECPGFFTDGVFLRGEWKGQVMRSTNGTSWQRTYTDPNDNTTFTDYSFAIGRVAPN